SNPACLRRALSFDSSGVVDEARDAVQRVQPPHRAALRWLSINAKTSPSATPRRAHPLRISSWACFLAARQHGGMDGAIDPLPTMKRSSHICNKVANSRRLGNSVSAV